MYFCITVTYSASFRRGKDWRGSLGGGLSRIECTRKPLFCVCAHVCIGAVLRIKLSWGRSRRTNKATILCEVTTCRSWRWQVTDNFFWDGNFVGTPTAVSTRGRISKFTVGNYFGAGILQPRPQRWETFDSLLVFLLSSLFSSK